MKRVTVLLLLMMVSVAGAQTTAPTSDFEQIKAAAIAFAHVLADPDFDKVKAQFAGDASELELLERIHGLIGAGIRHTAAQRKAFPDEKPSEMKSHANPERLAAKMAKISAEEVTIEGDSARVGTDGFTLKKVGGKWKVAVYITDPRAHQVFNKERSAEIQQMLEQSTADIEAGKFKSVAEVRTSTQRRERSASTSRPMR